MAWIFWFLLGFLILSILVGYSAAAWIVRCVTAAVIAIAGIAAMSQEKK